MSNTINDPAFGPMEFDYGWCKDEEIPFFGKTWSVEILAEAEIGQPISVGQQKCYTAFRNELQALSMSALEELHRFYSENLPYIGVQVDDPAELPEEEELTDADLIRMVTPKTVFFPQDNFYAILCDCFWEPINGLAIIISDEEISIGTQAEVL